MSINRNKHPSRPPLNKGMTLIEVMVSMLLLSIGMLGIAGLQAATNKYNINTASRASIAVLFSDLADRVRTNPDVAGKNYVTNLPATSEYVLADEWATQQSAALAIAKNCESTVCTASERATYDILNWRQSVRSSLPQGASLINGNKSDGFNITLMWFDKEFTDKRKTTNDGTATTAVALVNSQTCDGTETGLAKQKCCPVVAKVPAGVRCTSITFIP